MAEPLPTTVQDAMARTQAVLDSGRLSPWARARILGLRIALPPAKETLITVDCRTGRRTIEPMAPVAEEANPFDERPNSPSAILRSAPRAAVKILKAVAPVFDVRAADILGERRSIRETRPRFAAYRLLSEAGYSAASIGRALKRDHTSIINGLRRAAILHETDPDWRKLFDQVCEELAQ